MEFMSSFFCLICSFIVDIIYENTLINNLFSFYLNKKIISVKKRYQKINKYNCNTQNKSENSKKLDEKNSQLSKLYLNLNFKNFENKKKIILHKLSKSNNNSKNKFIPNKKIILEENLKGNENCEKNKNKKNNDNKENRT